MFEEAESFADIFRGGLPYYLLITLPILIICSSNPVLASSEFTVQRMSQFDVNGAAYGCRASALTLEAKSLYSWSTSRHCVVTKIQDLTIDQFRDVRQRAGGLVVLLPNNVSALSAEDKEHIYLLEQAMLAQVSNIPIYFSKYNRKLDQVVADITRVSDAKQSSVGQTKRMSASSELFDMISANGYQIVVSGSSHAVNKQSRIHIIQGELAPMKNIKNTDSEGYTKLPMIILTAHLKTFGIYREYPLNADTAALLTIAELFSKFLNTVNAAPRYRLMFLLTESGSLLNFQGIKKWLDENVQLQNVEFVLCLDTIIPALNANSQTLFMHVSKPPKDNTAMSNFFKILKTVGQQFPNMTIDGVHKKINLADVQLAWEHERFSMKRLPAFTISSLKSPKEPVRTTIFRDNESIIIENACRNTKIVAEALARYIYNIEDGEVFSGTMKINNNLIKSWMNINSAHHNSDLKNAFEKYLKNVKVLFDKPDTRDPDFMFYEGQEAHLYVYRVKPAVFDLFLTTLIAIYLTVFYMAIQKFPSFYTLTCRMTKTMVSSPKIKLN